MKKLNYLFLLIFLTAFAACSNDDDNSVKANFENMAVTNGYYANTGGTLQGFYYYSTFQDNDKLLTFDYYLGKWAGATFAGFTYTNSTDTKTGNSPVSVSGKAKIGTMYLVGYSNSYTPTRFKINNPSKYTINGCWISNSVYAYNCMTTNNYSPATKFKSGSYYKVIATGYAADGTTSVGTASIYLAKYSSDSDTPSKDWQWFDLGALAKAVYVQFDVDSSDKGQNGVNTSTNFCLDGITLNQK